MGSYPKPMCASIQFVEHSQQLVYNNGHNIDNKASSQHTQLSVRQAGVAAACLNSAMPFEEVRDVEQRILDMPEYESVYARSGVRLGNHTAGDITGRTQLRFTDGELRRPADDILDEVRAPSRRVAKNQIRRPSNACGALVDPLRSSPALADPSPRAPNRRRFASRIT